MKWITWDLLLIKMKDLDKFQKVLESLKGDGKYRIFNSILR